jgi:hypothetical protein
MAILAQPAHPAKPQMTDLRRVLKRYRDGQALTMPPVVPEHAYYDLADTAEPKDPDHTPAG